MAQQELSPLVKADQELGDDAANVVKENESQPRKQEAEKPDPSTLFKLKLKENDGCCSSWCCAHFFIIYLLLQNIANICIAGYHIKVLSDPYNTHSICYYPSDGGPRECIDERQFYEDAGLSIIFLSIEIAFLGIYTIVCILTLYGLQKAVPWIFLAMWLCINVQIIFILLHSILTGIYWGIFALLLPMLLSCYFWMLYNLAKYFQKGGIYDQNMSTLSPAPNNYAVLYVARPDDLAHYHANYKNEKKEPIDSKKLFRQKMNEGFDMCCCMCTLQTWSIIWLIYMIMQNILWFGSAVTTTVILYDDYGTWTDCHVYYADGSETTDCRELFEENGLTKAFSIIACIISALAVVVNVMCWWGLYQCNKGAIMAQCWMLFIQAIFMLLFSCFTGYYFGLFTMLIPMLLSCHFYDVYIVAVYCQQGVNTRRIPRMKAVVVMDADKGKQNQSQTQPQVVYVTAPAEQPIVYMDQNGKIVNQPIIDVTH